jgi:hypothetical protein
MRGDDLEEVRSRAKADDVPIGMYTNIGQAWPKFTNGC